MAIAIEKVKNLNGTSDSKPKGYDDWKDFWEKKTNRKFKKCSCTECENNAEVGAHVKRVCLHDLKGFEDDRWYIVPLCKKCNNTNNKKEFYIDMYDLCLENQ